MITVRKLNRALLNRQQVVPPTMKPLVYTKNGVMPGTVLIDGFVAGSYRWRTTGARAAD